MTDTQQRILDAIPYGADNAIKNRALALKTGIDEREIQDIIHSIVTDRITLVCASCRGRMGYFRPTSWEEARDGYLPLLSRESRIRERREGHQFLMKRDFGEQMEMGVVG